MVGLGFQLFKHSMISEIILSIYACSMFKLVGQRKAGLRASENHAKANK